MNRSTLIKRCIIGFLALLVAMPAVTFGESTGSGPLYSREELDQILAPIALYPDSLLAQVLVAATYPEQVMAADGWARENESLKGERLNAALDRQKWDLSVKALVPFPDVLAMMSEKAEWTQKLGSAFLAQQGDVMDSVQRLRARAHAQGSLQTTSHQKVMVKGEVIEIVPASPQVVYVPTYDPMVVYGTWMYPSYPPYPAYYPSGAVVASGMMGFAAGVAVGSAWHSGWGHWDWNHHGCNVNVNRNVNINRNINVNNINTTNWNNSNVNRGKDVNKRNTNVTDKNAREGSTPRTKDATGPRQKDPAVNDGAKGKTARESGQQNKPGQRGELRRGAGTGPGAGDRPSAESAKTALQDRGRGGAQGRLRRGDGNAPSGSPAQGNRRGALRGKQDRGLDGPREGLGGGPGGMGEGGGLRGGGGFRGRR